LPAPQPQRAQKRLLLLTMHLLMALLLLLLQAYIQGRQQGEKLPLLWANLTEVAVQTYHCHMVHLSLCCPPSSLMAFGVVVLPHGGS
jgi:hypothetical protein